MIAMAESPDTKYKKSRSDYLDELNDQLRSLELLTHAYDRGDTGHYRQMSNCLRLFFHTKGRTKSLLNRLTANTISMYDSSTPFKPDNLISHFGLVCIGFANGNKTYKPKCQLPPNPFNPGKWVAFVDWWNNTVYTDYRKGTLTRRDLILSTCEQDGGTHSDESLTDEAYVRLTRNPDGDIILGNIHTFIRQISFETTESIKHSKLFNQNLSQEW